MFTVSGGVKVNDVLAMHLLLLGRMSISNGISRLCDNFCIFGSFYVPYHCMPSLKTCISALYHVFSLQMDSIWRLQNLKNLYIYTYLNVLKQLNILQTKMLLNLLSVKCTFYFELQCINGITLSISHRIYIWSCFFYFGYVHAFSGFT